MDTGFRKSYVGAPCWPVLAGSPSHDVSTSFALSSSWLEGLTLPPAEGESPPADPTGSTLKGAEAKIPQPSRTDALSARLAGFRGPVRGVRGLVTSDKEAAKLTQDLLLRGVIETIIKESQLFQVLPFMEVAGETGAGLLPSRRTPGCWADRNGCVTKLFAQHGGKCRPCGFHLNRP